MSKTVRALLAGLVALAGLTAAVVAWVGRPAVTSAATGQPVAVDTTPVVRTDLSSTEMVPGSLGFGTARPLKGTQGGVVTWLPAPGSTITRGKQLYRVNDRAVPLFYGAVPLFRTLGEVNTVGRDVRTVAANLQALGYPIGAQPRTGATVVVTDPEPPPTAVPVPEPPSSPSTAPGATATRRPQTRRVVVRAGEDVLTTAMIRAVRRWQQDSGLPVTGRIDVGDVLVQPGAVRVDSLAAQVGDPAQAPLMSVTPTEKVVTVPVEAARAATIDKGDVVTVVLPQGTTAGKVTTVGTALQVADGASEGAPPKLTVAVTVDDPRTVADLDSADVQVGFVGETRQGVLAVPVGALVALSEGGYAVQVAGGGLVAVETGMFAMGLVEVTGGGLTEGTAVVTTS
ncbi:efflux RND transporter periplasmic adaptor subunit [Micromonospora sp. NPDC048835]|uniref:efflux RND transporter periplasmic adaptor subunit n=1 Tax=Micromonospora sp. NPDC048835 TaxID=3155147 RepID=UPI0033D8D9AE